MGVILREWKRGMSRHSVYQVLMILVLALCIFLSYALWRDLHRIRHARNTLINEVSDKTIFYTFYTPASWDVTRFESDDARVHIQAFLNALKNEPGIRTYDVVIQQNIEILSGLPDLPDTFYWGYRPGEMPVTLGDTHPINVFQVTPNFMEEFGMEISEGRSFSEDSFHYELHTPVEVVLGAGYREYVDLHDRFTISYEQETVVDVVGFLKEGAVFVDQSGSIKTVDYGILMPQFTSAGQTQYRDSEQFMMQVLANGAPNVIVESADIDVGALLNEMAVRYDAFPITVAPISYANTDQIESLTGQQLELTLIMTGFVFLVVIATLTILISSRIRSDLRTYAIYILTGRSFRHIFGMLLLENLVLVLLAAVPAVYMLGHADGLGLGGGMLKYLLKRIWIYAALLLVLVSVLTARILNRRNLIAPLQNLR